MWTRLILFCALCAAIPLAAQEQVITCLPSETVQSCQKRFTPTGSAPIPAALTRSGAVTETASRLQAKASGPDLSSAGSLSAINDFLPRLATALLAPAVGGGSPELGLKTNLPLNDGVLFRLGMTSQLAAVFHEPKLFAPLLDSIPEGIREASRSRLEAGLNVYDNVAVTVAINVENARWGRSLRPHLLGIDSLARSLLPTPRGGDPVIAARQALARFMRGLDDRLKQGDTTILTTTSATGTCVPGPDGLLDVRIDCLTPGMRDTIQEKIGVMANAVARHITAASQTIRESGFTRIAQLVNNQPQFNLSLELDPRRSLVGPTEWSGKARFEMGFANWNGLRRFCRAATDEQITTQCLKEYTHDGRVTGSLSRADRVFLELTVTRRDAWHVALPADSVDLSFGGATTLAVSGGYGAYLGNAADGDNRDRLDLRADYDFARDDALRQNRWVSSLFYTRHVTGQATALIGLTWANRPEFLGDVTRHLGANIGFTYKLNQDPESAAGQK